MWRVDGQLGRKTRRCRDQQSNSLTECGGQAYIPEPLKPKRLWVAVGTHNAQVQLWDVGCCKQIGEMTGHRSRVSSLSWNGQLVSSGSRDSAIHHYDVRAPPKQVATRCLPLPAFNSDQFRISCVS